MGRITIYAINGCPFCIKAKEALKKRKIPYLEINLSSHPDKRSDLLNISNSLTVPQIFFNEEHIGGSVELIAVLEQWDKEEKGNSNSNGSGSGISPLQRYQTEIKAKPDPIDARLQPSAKDAVIDTTEAPPRNEGDKILLFNSSQKVTVLEMTRRLLNTVPTNDLVYRGKTYKHAITGCDLISCLMKEFKLSNRSEALEFGVKTLNKRQLLTHVTGDHELSDRNDLYFRLQPHQSPNVLNSFRVWTDRVDPNALAVLSRLSKKLQQIFDRATDSEGIVNLSNAMKDSEYDLFEEEICELQHISMDGMGTNTKTAFVINLYNLLIKYAQIKVGVPSTNLQRASFFTGVTVNVGGEIFSFHDLENGILRSNALPPYALKKVFASNDTRLKLIVDKVDPRIHFGLNCGARSCPPVKKFTVNDLNEELRIVALAFCEQDIKLDESTNSMHCNTIFKWYSKDFARSVNALPKEIVQFLNPNGGKYKILQSMIKKGSIKIVFEKYDWGSNVSHSKDFDKSELNANQFKVKNLFLGV